MSAPRIAINASYLKQKSGGWAVTVKGEYVDAVLRAGGVPLVLPPVERSGYAKAAGLLAEADGLLLIGGGDIRAERYGAEQSPRGDLVHVRREAFDFFLLGQALRGRKAVLGICLGCQVLNVFHGGTLYQHLPEERPESRVRHKLSGDAPAMHRVEVGSGTLLSRILRANSLQVNSTHHQAIRDIGRGLVAAAHAEDGLVEAIEGPRRPFVAGVQWHPEAMPDDARQRALFRAFIHASMGQAI